jgi:hypothetical protein
MGKNIRTTTLLIYVQSPYFAWDIKLMREVVVPSPTSEKADACNSTPVTFRLTRQRGDLLLTEILPIRNWISSVVV